MRLALNPVVLRWARERAGLAAGALAKKIGVRPSRVEEWEKSGEITFVQAEKLAHHTHTPIGYLYLQQPVQDRLPIPDFRTVDDTPLGNPSPDLLETVQAMLRRQAWMHDWLVEEEQPRLNFVGSVDLGTPVVDVARAMRQIVGLEGGWANEVPTWVDAMRQLRNQIEQAGVMVVINGVVGNNTHRRLSTQEFRGFALIDDYAPLIFVNGTDARAAQMFTLVHELAHIWIGKSGVSNFEHMEPMPHETELFCNRVAAEFLVPEVELRAIWDTIPEDAVIYQALARHFKVSSIVAARRALDLQLIDHDTFFDFYRAWQEQITQTHQRGGGGDFWNNQNVRIGRLFGSAVVRATKEGRLLYQDAYSLTNLRGRTFDEFVRHLEDAV